MAYLTDNQVMVRVIETNAVDYKKHSFLFFSWYVKVSSTKIRNDLFIATNDNFDSVFINNKAYKLTPPVQE